MWVVIVRKTKLISLTCIVRFGITSLQILGYGVSVLYVIYLTRENSDITNYAR